MVLGGLAQPEMPATHVEHDWDLFCALVGLALQRQIMTILGHLMGPASPTQTTK